MYAVQFIVSILSFGAGRTGCWCMTTPLHIALCLSKTSWQDNRSPFCHTPHTHLISQHAISLSLHHLKGKLCGHQFQSPEEIVAATREAIQDLPADIFQQCFQQLHQRWQTYIVANGDYFEGGCGYV
jgi:hypothetical protein